MKVYTIFTGEGETTDSTTGAGGGLILYQSDDFKTTTACTLDQVEKPSLKSAEPTIIFSDGLS